MAVAAACGRQALHDVRVPSVEYPIANGVKRSGKRCLAVGTDCSVGKMYTALAMDKEMQARGMNATFRPTGQTGILVTGDGVPLDAVVADFMAGAVEWLTPDNDADHWDLIEGQGSLFHVSYLGRDDGADPWRAAGCADPVPTSRREPICAACPAIDLPSLEELRDTALPLAKVANPTMSRSWLVSRSTPSTWMKIRQWHYLAEIEARMGLPATDPFRQGAGKSGGRPCAGGRSKMDARIGFRNRNPVSYDTFPPNGGACSPSVSRPGSNDPQATGLAAPF